MPANEAARIESLRNYNILDTEPEAAYDDIAGLAAAICGTPIAAVALVDIDRQWFKSILGYSIRQTSRDISFCAYTILQLGLMVVSDTLGDVRFAENPLVTGEPHVRFYAGAPLVTESGHAVGALCVCDQKPRSLSQQQQDALEILARQVMNNFDLARRVILQDRLIADRERAQDELVVSTALQRQFLKDVLAGVTEGRLILCQSRDDLPQSLSPFGGSIALSGTSGLRLLRETLQQASLEVSLPPQAAHDIIMAAGETGMNAIVHAGSGAAQVFINAARGTVQVEVRDDGTGIMVENLPNATLKKGYTTAGTLGHGMKMMLQTADRVFLLTGASGTTVILEQDRDTAPDSGLWV